NVTIPRDMNHDFYVPLVPPPTTATPFPYTTLFRSSAHGTNPATCAMLDYDIVPLPTGPNGIVEVEAVKKLIDSEVAGLMITNPKDRKSTRLNSSHVKISYAVFCLKKKKK